MYINHGKVSFVAKRSIVINDKKQKTLKNY